MTVFYFTGTGNCLYVAKTIGGQLYSIPQLMKNKQFDFEDDIIGLVFPVYGWSIPKIVNQFINNIKIKANYTFVIGTYGMIAGSCIYNFVKHLKTKNIEIDYADSIKMVDNYLPNFEMKNQIKTLGKKNVNEKLNILVNNINNRKNHIPYSGIGERFLTRIIKLMLSNILDGKSAQNYIVNENCNKCGICIKLCPTGNIDIKDKVVFNSFCEVCYACVQNCPQNSIHLKNEKSSVRFRNENITLNEIIQANNQK